MISNLQLDKDYFAIKSDKSIDNNDNNKLCEQSL